ncbi:hypothetical protein ES332_A11G188800v1 [Gossypium tomentosum]|uniref:Uncharacterized protein n=1 Tax=Gossypium tomentosum TaxID=34277 RepID=A0A5D2NDP3_GOSTO|nr:hypothetical protein ES332_A11G188800v1 [Gossypium tomentosum]
MYQVLPFLRKKYIWSSEEEFSNEEEFSSEEEQDEEEISKEDVREEAKSFLEIPKLHVEKILLNCIRLNERQHILEVEMKERKAEMNKLKTEFEKANHLLETLTEGYPDLLSSLVRHNLHWRDLIIRSKVLALIPKSKVEDESINEIHRLHVQNVKGELMKLRETKEKHIRTKKHMLAILENTHPLTFRGPLDDGQIGLDDDEQIGSDDDPFSIRFPHLTKKVDFRSQMDWAFPHGLDIWPYARLYQFHDLHLKHAEKRNF